MSNVQIQTSAPDSDSDVKHFVSAYIKNFPLCWGSVGFCGPPHQLVPVRSSVCSLVSLKSRFTVQLLISDPLMSEKCHI